MTARRRFGATLVALAALGASWLPAGLASAEEPALVSAPPGTSSSSVKTTVVGMTLRGVKQFDRLELPDFDILVQANGNRLLPLLRTLRFMGIEARSSGSRVSFTPEPSTPIALDPDKGLLEVGGTAREVETVSGISDVTGESEIYIPESVVAEILGVGIDWNPDLYEYTIRSSRPLDVFERQFTRGRSVSGADAFESYALPGNLPPADPTPSIVPKLLFARVQLQASAIRHGDETRTTGTFSPPRGALWAQIFGGSLNTRVSQRTESPGDGFKVDALAWNTVFDETALSLGTGNVGLSQLVFPSLSLVGATINGNVGSGSNLASRDPSQLGKMQTYAPLHVFEGFAPLGSNVSLWVNDNLVESKTVESTTGGPPGEGAYRFEGLNLFTSRLNEVRIVTTAPDGTVEESRRRVLGTDLLLSNGRVSFVGVAGRRRRFSADNLAATGAFGGGRVDYGLSQRLTVGASGGYQRDIFLEEDESVFGGEHLRRPPSQSLHLGSRVVWQPVDPLLLSMEGARSGWYADSSTGATLRGDAEYHLGNFEIRSGIFRYEPRFFDGQNQELNDIQGGNLGIALNYARGHQIGLVGSRLRDNLDGTRAATTRVREAQASWSVQGLIPRSTLTVAGRQIWGYGVSRHRSYLLGLDSSLPWRWEFRGRYEFGDDIPGLLRKEMSVGTYERFDLADRMPTGFYLPGLSLGSGSLNSIFELRRRAIGNWQLNLTHRSAGTFERSSVDLVRSVSAQSKWQTRISPGYDWNKQSALIQNRLEVFLDQSRRNRVSLEANYDDHEWSARVSMGLQLDFGFSGLAPVPLFDGRVDPDAGGVRGRVFLDQNGNGLPDRGERGLDGIDIMSGQGSRTVSGNDGMFLLPNASNLRRVRVHLDPASLSAVYTPTQATQEAILRPGVFTEVNLGISMLGTVSGVLLGRAAPTDSSAATDPAGPAAAELKGVPGVKVLLVAEDGRVAGFSVTGSDGVYTIVDAKPGRYKIRPDAATLPEGFQLDIGEIPVEVRSGEDAADLRAADLIGHHTSPRPKDEGAKEDIEYKTFR